MRIWYRVGLRARNMAEPHVHVLCVHERNILRKVGQAKKESQITLFIEDSYFDKAKPYLKYLED